MKAAREVASHFEREFLKNLGAYAGAVLASIVLAMLLAAAFSAGVAWLMGLPAHVVRILIPINATGPLYRIARYLARR